MQDKDFNEPWMPDAAVVSLQRKVIFYLYGGGAGVRDPNRCERKHSQSLGAMFKLKNILSQKKLATVYRASIESHLRYCSVIWGCLSNTKLESLQRLQNRVRRLIVCARHKDGWVCDWLDVRNLIKYDRLITT